MAKRRTSLEWLKLWRVRWVRRWWWAPLVAVGVPMVLWLLLGPVTYWAAGSQVTEGLAAPAGDSLSATERIAATKERAAAINAARQTVLQAVGGTAALSALVFTATNFLLNRRGQFTERYSRAVEQLSSEQMASRIGGIYALEHLMRESEQDHSTVVEVLAAFVRENAPRIPEQREPVRDMGNWMHPPAGTADDAQAHSTRRKSPRTDVQTALTVLGRRPHREEKDPVDLSETDLRGADLRALRFDDADLSGVDLERADLTNAHLEFAFLTGAHLKSINLMNAHLVGTDLSGAHLEYANLVGADLESADLGYANLANAGLIEARLVEAGLDGACLEHADLSGAHLEDAFMVGARLDYADLRGAHLQRANLVGAHLEYANLVNTNFEGADVSETFLDQPDDEG